MSDSALRFKPATDCNSELHQKIVALAQRHRCYGAAIICLKLRQADELVNHLRVERMYAQAGLLLGKHKREGIPRCPLGRATTTNSRWFMDFVFDRTAEGATHETVAGLG